MNPSRTCRLTVLLEEACGGIRDPQVSYDAKRILFSYRKGATHHFNLWEINADGGELRQITTGDWDDIEPCYLPDGGIAFCSILSTVPVAADGSAFFEVPPMRSLYLALLDGDDRSIKQMRSFMTLQPGEPYVREMRRYGVLPAGSDLVEDPIDVYAIDRKYWQSLWWRPETKGSARTAEERSQHDEAGHTGH